MVPQRQPQLMQPRRRARPSRIVLACGVIAVLAAAAVSFAALALGSGTAVTVGSASSAKLGERVLVDARGRTLYALSPETTRHLLCTSGRCRRFWPPLTVRSRKARLKAGTGVQGRLEILRRRDGLLQVTLRGLPLYRFAHDHAAGEVNGEGIESFGGTWHAVSAAASPPPAPRTTPSAPTTTPSAPAPAPTPGYGY
jgi:predicted lipoprotein with Yx(FWY)xxD motif